MGKHSQCMFARAVLNALRILTQILKSWLMITLKWNTRVVLLVLKLLKPPPPLLGNKGLRTSTTTRVFHSKVIASQDLWICVNIRNASNIALANMGCECFPITHICIFYPVIISCSVLYPIYFTVSCTLYQSNSVTWLYISFSHIIPFLEQ